MCGPLCGRPWGAPLAAPPWWPACTGRCCSLPRQQTATWRRSPARGAAPSRAAAWRRCCPCRGVRGATRRPPSAPPCAPLWRASCAWSSCPPSTSAPGVGGRGASGAGGAAQAMCARCCADVNQQACVRPAGHGGVVTCSIHAAASCRQPPAELSCPRDRSLPAPGLHPAPTRPLFPPPAPQGPLLRNPGGWRGLQAAHPAARALPGGRGPRGAPHPAGGAGHGAHGGGAAGLGGAGPALLHTPHRQGPGPAPGGAVAWARGGLLRRWAADARPAARAEGGVRAAPLAASCPACTLATSPLHARTHTHTHTQAL